VVSMAIPAKAKIRKDRVTKCALNL